MKSNQSEVRIKTETKQQAVTEIKKACLCLIKERKPNLMRIRGILTQLAAATAHQGTNLPISGGAD